MTTADDIKSLVQAAEAGDIATAQQLLNRGADVHARNNSAFILAARYGYTEMVQLLLDHGADVHADNDNALYAQHGMATLRW